MERSKVLVADDDPQVVSSVANALRMEGVSVETAADGAECLEKMQGFRPDLVVLDISFAASSKSSAKTLDGMEVLRRIRQRSSVPVLILSSTSIQFVKVSALTLGADDYVTKPFDSQELTARVRAILRRSRHAASDTPRLRFKRIEIDLDSRRLWKDGKEIDLRPMEFDILAALARRPGHVFERVLLLDLVRKHEYCGSERAVDVHIGRIRKKLEDDPASPTLLVTVRSAGYRFEDVPAKG